MDNPAASEHAIVAANPPAAEQAIVAENQLEAGQLVEHPYQYIKYRIKNKRAPPTKRQTEWVTTRINRNQAKSEHDLEMFTKGFHAALDLNSRAEPLWQVWLEVEVAHLRKSALTNKPYTEDELMYIMKTLKQKGVSRERLLRAAVEHKVMTHYFAVGQMNFCNHPDSGIPPNIQSVIRDTIDGIAWMNSGPAEQASTTPEMPAHIQFDHERIMKAVGYVDKGVLEKEIQQMIEQAEGEQREFRREGLSKEQKQDVRDETATRVQKEEDRRRQEACTKSQAARPTVKFRRFGKSGNPGKIISSQTRASVTKLVTAISDMPVIKAPQFHKFAHNFAVTKQRLTKNALSDLQKRRDHFDESPPSKRSFLAQCHAKDLAREAAKQAGGSSASSGIQGTELPSEHCAGMGSKRRKRQRVRKPVISAWDSDQVVAEKMADLLNF